jgi:hypothetical protein
MDFGDSRSYFNEMFVALLMIIDNNDKTNGENINTFARTSNTLDANEQKPN